MEVETIEPCGKQENLDPIQVISVIAASFYNMHTVTPAQLMRPI